MNIAVKPPKASAGRPPLRSEEETLDVLITAAIEEYRDKSYAKSTMNAIAKRAGISLRTLYKIVSDKEALFRLATERRIAQHILSLDAHSSLLNVAPKEALLNLTCAYAHQVLNRETIFTTKLVISESDHFPELAQSFVISTRRITKAFDHNFALIAQKSDIIVTSEQIELLRLALIGAQRIAILTPDPAMSDADINALAQRSLRLVLNEVS